MPPTPPTAPADGTYVMSLALHVNNAASQQAIMCYGGNALQAQRTYDLSLFSNAGDLGSYHMVTLGGITSGGSYVFIECKMLVYYHVDVTFAGVSVAPECANAADWAGCVRDA